METEPGSSDDARTTEQIRYDAMSDQVREAASSVMDLAKIVKQLASGGGGNVQTVIHKQQGMGAVGIVCAAVCVLCVLFLMVELNRVDGRLRDLDAWRSVHSNDIGALKADVRQLQKGTGK